MAKEGPVLQPADFLVWGLAKNPHGKSHGSQTYSHPQAKNKLRIGSARHFPLQRDTRMFSIPCNFTKSVEAKGWFNEAWGRNGNICINKDGSGNVGLQETKSLLGFQGLLDQIMVYPNYNSDSIRQVDHTNTTL